MHVFVWFIICVLLCCAPAVAAARPWANKQPHLTAQTTHDKLGCRPPLPIRPQTTTAAHGHRLLASSRRLIAVPALAELMCDHRASGCVCGLGNWRQPSTTAPATPASQLPPDQTPKLQHPAKHKTGQKRMTRIQTHPDGPTGTEHRRLAGCWLMLGAVILANQVFQNKLTCWVT